MGQSTSDGSALDDWIIDYGHDWYGRSDVYEHLGGGLSGLRTDYFGAGSEPCGLVTPFLNKVDDSRKYRDGRHGFGAGRRGSAFDLPP